MTHKQRKKALELEAQRLLSEGLTHEEMVRELQCQSLDPNCPFYRMVAQSGQAPKGMVIIHPPEA